MRGGAFPLWVYGMAALLIALTAFALGQVRPGLGMGFVPFVLIRWAASQEDVVEYGIAAGLVYAAFALWREFSDPPVEELFSEPEHG